jgi:hypothetical protein
VLLGVGTRPVGQAAREGVVEAPGRPGPEVVVTGLAPPANDIRQDLWLTMRRSYARRISPHARLEAVGPVGDVCQDQSGDKNRLGHITREVAPVVRQLVAEATWQALRRSPTVGAQFERAQRSDPQRKKIAVLATAHYLVRVMWAMLKQGTVWEENLALAS